MLRLPISRARPHYSVPLTRRQSSIRRDSGRVDMDASTSTGDAHLWTPEADSRPVAGHEPDGVTMRPSLDDGKAEHIGIELLGCLQVYDFEDQLADACHVNAGAHTDSQRPARFPDFRYADST